MQWSEGGSDDSFGCDTALLCQTRLHNGGDGSFGCGDALLCQLPPELEQVTQTESGTSLRPVDKVVGQQRIRESIWLSYRSSGRSIGAARARVALVRKCDGVRAEKDSIFSARDTVESGCVMKRWAVQQGSGAAERRETSYGSRFTRLFKPV